MIEAVGGWRAFEVVLVPSVNKTKRFMGTCRCLILLFLSKGACLRVQICACVVKFTHLSSTGILLVLNMNHCRSLHSEFMSRSLSTRRPVGGAVAPQKSRWTPLSSRSGDDGAGFAFQTDKSAFFCFHITDVSLENVCNNKCKFQGFLPDFSTTSSLQSPGVFNVTPFWKQMLLKCSLLSSSCCIILLKKSEHFFFPCSYSRSG